MTVIAYDGRKLAADKQVTSEGGFKRTASKLRVTEHGVLAWNGRIDHGIDLMDWFESGAKPEEFPEHLLGDACEAELIVVRAGGAVTYSGVPTPTPVLDGYMAWGSGRDFAMGAMYAGADAIGAVKAAIHWSAECGLGIDVFAQPMDA